MSIRRPNTAFSVQRRTSRPALPEGGRSPSLEDLNIPIITFEGTGDHDQLIPQSQQNESLDEDVITPNEQNASTKGKEPEGGIPSLSSTLPVGGESVKEKDKRSIRWQPSALLANPKSLKKISNSQRLKNYGERVVSFIPTRKEIFGFLDDPSSSKYASWWAIWMLIVILVATVCVILESIYTIRAGNDDLFHYTEIIVIVFFSIDYFGRLLTCPNLRKFVIDPMNILALASILPYYVQLTLKAANQPTPPDDFMFRFTSLRILQLIRIFKMLSSGKRSLLFQLFIRSIMKGKDGIVFLIFVQFLLVVFFSTCLFYVETAACHLEDGLWVYNDPEMGGEPTVFQHIPVTFWWCIVTLTTTGYGDMTPVTVAGRLVAACTMLSAIVVMTFPVTILSHAFGEAAEEFNRAKEERRRQEILRKTMKRARESMMKTRKSTDEHVDIDVEAIQMFQKSPLNQLERVSKELESLQKQAAEKEKLYKRLVVKLAKSYKDKHPMELFHASMALDTAAIMDFTLGRQPDLDLDEDTA